MSRPPKPVRYEKKPMRDRTGPPSGLEGPSRCGSLPKPCWTEIAAKGPSERSYGHPRRLADRIKALEQFPPIGVLVGEQLRHEVDQPLQRQADDVEVVALDALDEHGAGALDGVAAGAALPFAGAHVPVQQRGVRRAETDLGDLDRGVAQLAVTDDGDRADDLVGASRQAREVCARLAGVGRLAEDVAVDGHERVRPQRQRARHRQRLAARVLLGDGDRTAVGLLLDARDADVERDADLLEDRAPLRRRRRERQPSSGKNSPASRIPDSGESEPWTMFVPTAIAKSPRIEPVVASSGLVAPITWRAALTASSPSKTSAMIGPEVMKDTSSPKNGRSVCSA